MPNDQADGLRVIMENHMKFPDVPDLMLHYAESNRIAARNDDIREVVMPLIETASNEELQQIAVAIKCRAVKLNGCATELEDWLVSVGREIKSKKGI